MDEFNQIYETMLGLLEPEAALPWVDNAFEEGRLCPRAYEQMRQAYERLCERLGVENEDDDLNMIVDSLESIQKELCQRIFETGMRYISENRHLQKG